MVMITVILFIFVLFFHVFRFKFIIIENKIILYLLVVFRRVVYQVFAPVIGSLVNIFFNFKLLEIFRRELYLIEFVKYHLIIMIQDRFFNEVSIQWWILLITELQMLRVIWQYFLLKLILNRPGQLNQGTELLCGVVIDVLSAAGSEEQVYDVIADLFILLNFSSLNLLFRCSQGWRRKDILLDEFRLDQKRVNKETLDWCDRGHSGLDWFLTLRRDGLLWRLIHILRAIIFIDHSVQWVQKLY